MEEGHPTLVTVDQTRKRVCDTRNLVSNTRKLITATHRVFEQNLAIYKNAQVTIQRLQVQGTQSRSKVGRPQRARGLLHLLISARIDEGRLPETALRTALASGFGGQCEACDSYMPSTQLGEGDSQGRDVRVSARRLLRDLAGTVPIARSPA